MPHQIVQDEPGCYSPVLADKGRSQICLTNTIDLEKVEGDPIFNFIVDGKSVRRFLLESFLKFVRIALERNATVRPELQKAANIPVSETVKPEHLVLHSVYQLVEK